MKVLKRPVTSAAELRRRCAELDGKPYIAMDTEFTRQRTYRPILEILQIATDDIAFCVDAAGIDDWSGVRNIVQAPASTVVFHAAEQDLEVLELQQLVPARIIDSQIAAQLCGAEKLSYQHLIEQHLGVKLSKDQTRSDWSRRPLTTQQIDYALDDVRYLLPLFQHFQNQLQHRQRIPWLEEECARLFDRPRGASQLVTAAWTSFDGGAMLGPADQQIAKALLIWREERAISINRPRQWILSNQQIMSLITKKPATVQQTASLLGIKRKPAMRWVARVHAILTARRAIDSAPLWTTKKKLNDGEKKQVHALLEQIGVIANLHQIPPPLLCTRQEAINTVRGERSARFFSGWRKSLLDSMPAPLFSSPDGINAR